MAERRNPEKVKEVPGLPAAGPWKGALAGRVSLPPDWLPLLLMLIIPFILRLAELSGAQGGNPMVLFSGLASHWTSGIMAGWPTIDPNGGFTSQALGHRAALDWLSGRVPWWNPYEGVGVPLAGESKPQRFFRRFC